MQERTYLEHWCDATASSNHADSLNFALNHLLAHLVSDHELRVAKVVHISTDGRDLHLIVPIPHLVNELSEDTTYLVFKVAQVDFDEQINVACVCHLGERMVKPLKLLSADLSLKLEVLAREVTER